MTRDQKLDVPKMYRSGFKLGTRPVQGLVRVGVSEGYKDEESLAFQATFVLREKKRRLLSAPLDRTSTCFVPLPSYHQGADFFN